METLIIIGAIATVAIVLAWWWLRRRKRAARERKAAELRTRMGYGASAADVGMVAKAPGTEAEPATDGQIVYLERRGQQAVRGGWEDAPTARQLAYLDRLAHEAGVRAPRPATMREATEAIGELAGKLSRRGRESVWHAERGECRTGAKRSRDAPDR